ncbi:MAG: FtsW/RodA/SpoVE family cell cycle protein [Actinomycetes bacterium]
MSGTVASPSARQPTRRLWELLLLVFAWLIGVLGFLQIQWANGEGANAQLWLTVTVVGVLALVSHGVVQWKARYADPIILPLATLLTMLGLIMIYRLDVAAAHKAELNGNPSPSPDVYAQLTWFTIAIILFIAVLFVVRDHRTLQRYTYTLGLMGLILLVLPLAPFIGTTINGATLWLRVGGFSFQPAEAAKILLTIFFAGYLVEKRDSLALVRTNVMGVGLPRGKDLGPILIAWGVSLAILVLENDLGTSMLFFGLFVCMLYIATQRRSWLILGGLLFLVGAVLSYVLVSHVQIRVTVWLDPWTYSDTSGFQIVQSLFGLANGGMLGSGLGRGFPNLVPFANTDFIISALGEELGVTGLVALLLMYALLIERGLRTAVSVKDAFGQLLAAGLSIVLALQVFVIVGGVTRLIPLTGLTTPFLSYGGSSLVANWIIVALLLRISDRARRPDIATPAADDALTQVVRRI